MNSFCHTLRTPGGEWVVIIPHYSSMFNNVSPDGISNSINDQVLLWLNKSIGPEHKSSVTLDGYWRHRIWGIGKLTSHSFFFLERRDAIKFAITWGEG